MDLSNIAILNIKGSDYGCIINLISKNETVNIMRNADLTEKVEHYKTKSNFEAANLNENAENYKIKNTKTFKAERIERIKNRKNYKIWLY